MDFYKYLTLLGVALFCFMPASPGFGEQVPEQEIKKAIIEYVKDHTSWKEDQIEVTDIAHIPDLVLPAGSVRYEVRSAPRSSLLGRTDFEVNVSKDGGEGHFFRVTAQITIWVDALLASHPIKGGKLIGEGDTYVGKRHLGDLPSSYRVNPEEVIGMKARYFIGANTVFFEDNVKEPPIFQKGDRVNVLAESESLKIIALGEAKEDGYKGKMVRVMNLQSKKEIKGEVAEDGWVHVRF